MKNMKTTQLIKVFFLLIKKTIWFLLNPVKMNHSN